MSSKDIIVPVHVKALAVNKNVLAGQKFRRWRFNFNNLKFFTSPEAEPFGGGEDDFHESTSNEGVYLHWELPKALKHGVQQAGANEMEFPLVPNRWVVVRFSGSLDKRTATAWVIESDYISSADGTSSFLDPSIPYDPEDPGKAATLLGRSISLNTPSQWKETSSKALFLKAIGPGDVVFSDYQPLVDNVFSFHDPLDGNDVDNLSYMVAGWYSNPSDDVISKWSTPKEFSTLLTNLQWQLPDKTAGTPVTSLYQGMVYGIEWNRTLGNPSDYFNPDGAFVAFGNTAADALTAMVKKQKTDQKNQDINPDLVEALQYNYLHYLDDKNGTEKLEQKIHQAWFGSNPGGVTWEALNNPDVSDDQLDITSSYLAQEASWVAKLNKDQLAYELAWLKYQSLQQKLYAEWLIYYKRKNKLFPPSTLPSEADLKNLIDPTVANNTYAQVKAQLAIVSAFASNLPQITGTVPKDIESDIKKFADSKGISTQRILKRVANPGFYHANDPVVVIQGANYQPGPSIESGLTCRLSDQLINGLTYKASASATGQNITMTELKTVVPSLNLTNLPLNVQAIWNEFFLTDPQNAQAIAKVALNSTDSAVIQNLKDQISKQDQFVGIKPAFLPGVWKQPWNPIFMEWTVQWYPIPYDQSGSKLWEFDGDNYDWNGSGTITQSPTEISGRSFLTPQTQFTFKRKLEQFIKDQKDTDLGHLDDFIKSTDNWDFVSQTLTGFNDQLKNLSSLSNTHPPTTSTGPFGGIADLIGEEYSDIPSPDSQLPFDGIRAGQLNIGRLMVYDAFGQAIEIVQKQQQHAGPRSSDNFRPVIGRGLQPSKFVQSANTQRFIQLPPRLLQGGRLKFDFLDAKDDAKVLNLDLGSNPICGWMLPNHLDMGLSIYGPLGNAIGELRIFEDSSNKKEVQFTTVPNSSYANIQDVINEYAHMGDALNAIINLGPDAFINYLTVIDSTLWSVDPLGGRHDKFMSVMIGRPLALARVKLQFELYGQVVKDMAWANVLKQEGPAFTGYDFEIKLGNQGLLDDGLIGYYVGKDSASYNTFNVVHDLSSLSLQSGSSSFLKEIKPGNFIKLKFDDVSASYLTMLVDPRAVVHAQTDIIPTVTIEIPDNLVSQAFDNMDLYFESGPILTAPYTGLSTQTDSQQTPEKIDFIDYVPPGEDKLNWKWEEQTTSVKKDSWDTYSIKPLSSKAKLSPEPNTLREGWMSLIKKKSK